MPPSSLQEAMCLPSAEKAREDKGTLGTLIVLRSAGLLPSDQRCTAFRLADARVLPSGAKASPSNSSFSVCIVASSFNEAPLTSHSRMVKSLPAEASVLLSAEKATELRQSRWPSNV